MYRFNVVIKLVLSQWLKIPWGFFDDSKCYLNNKYARILRIFKIIPQKKKKENQEEEKGTVKDIGVYYIAIMIKTM